MTYKISMLFIPVRFSDSSANSYKELAGSGFRRLAGYIFGGNEADKKISMAAPVHMDINDSKSAMSFVMPSSYQLFNRRNEVIVSLEWSEK